MLKLSATNLSQIPGIAHSFFGRQGGVSEGIYASLNCGPGSNDVREHVAENRRRVLRELGGDSLLTLYQIHSPNTVIATEPWEQGPQADAIATNVPGLALGILTADCAPVLFADPVARVVGAAHAGWKGAVSGVIESVLEKMESLGANRARIAAAIGPCISQTNYEVGPEFFARFSDAGADNTRFFVPSEKTDHWRFDLEFYVANRLRSAGVGNIEKFATCTYAGEESFFSFRRATHRGEPDYGRQVSTIVLK
ncbi:MAG TPA: peptidoglycan editing factor PgeF [Rhizomicrobium sp.]